MILFMLSVNSCLFQPTRHAFLCHHLSGFSGTRVRVRTMISGKNQLIFLFENSTHPLHPRAVKSCYIAFDRNVPRVGLDIDCVGGAGGAGWKVPLPLCPCPVRGIILILYLCECISVSCRPCPCPGTVFSLLMSDVCWSCWILI